jgi:hypothetical protein
MSPIFYTAVESQSPKFINYTNNAVNKLMNTGGYDYFLLWKNRIFLGSAIITCAVLLMIEVNSAYIIECIVCTTISSVLTDKIYTWYTDVESSHPIEQPLKQDTVTIKTGNIQQPQIIDDYIPYCTPDIHTETYNNIHQAKKNTQNTQNTQNFPRTPSIINIYGDINLYDSIVITDYQRNE